MNALKVSTKSRISSWVWLLLPCLAAAFLVWVNVARFERMSYLAGLPGRVETVGPGAAPSATGYANGQRELILPDRNENSFHWIAQTQQMFARSEWRVRYVDYDNSPFGRSVSVASPYRWWLGVVAWTDHLISGRPIGLSVERAALWGDPVLLGLLLLGGTFFVAWQFGRAAAAVLALGLVATFPFAAEFSPGVPDSHGLALAFTLAGCVALLAGMSVLFSRQDPAGRVKSRRWFLLAGLLGGGALWINVSMMVPVLLGIVLGALLAAIVMCRSQPDASLAPWRWWAAGGGAAVLVACLAEYFPAHLGTCRLESIHPLYGLAWIGLGELLVRAVEKIQRREKAFRAVDAIVLVLSVIAVAAVPIGMFKTESAGFLSRDLSWPRLTHLPEGVTAPDFLAWVLRDGLSATVAVVLLPLSVVGVSVWLVVTGGQATGRRALLALMLGPVVVAAGFAWQELSWWSVLDGLLLVVLVALVPAGPSGSPRPRPWLWLATAGFFIVPGFVQLLPRSGGNNPPVLTATEARLLIERDLAHWLAIHSDYERAVVYAPPDETTTLAFHGGLRGIGTYCLDNEMALQATLKIASAGSIQEALLLLQGRGVRYLVLPSWDSFFEDYARLYETKNAARWNGVFISVLRDWQLPLWLRPLPYETPEIAGLGKQSVQVFEVVGDQSPAVAASRLSECLVAIGEMERAAQSIAALRQFPGDIGALTAEAQVEFALGDTTALNRTIESLLLRLKGGSDRYLPWDRRVSLAIVLARAKRADLARLQLQQCVAVFDEKKAAALSTSALYNLLGLVRVYGLEITNSRARAWSLQLLPPAMRKHVQ